jgi:hypothetical protein
MPSDQPGKKIDVEKIDLDRMREKTAENAPLLPYGHHVGSAAIKPEDKGKIKGRAVQAMYEQTDQQLSQIQEQVQLLVDQAKRIEARKQLSERIYQAKISFEPLINRVYYLYQDDKGLDLMSMLSPQEWGRSLPHTPIASIKLLADHTWEVMEDYTNKEGQ